MAEFLKKFKKFYYFKFANPVKRRGEAGGFKWRFRKYCLEIETLSGNFSARFVASAHPFGYLAAGEDSQVQGFSERLYMIGNLMTTDQKFVDDLDKALKRYEKRLEKIVPDPDDSEEAALAFEKSVQEHLELPVKERKKAEKEIDKRFDEAVKKSEKQSQISSENDINGI